MMKKEERMKQLVNANIETGKYFTFDLPEGLTPGTKIHLVFDEDGTPQVKPATEVNSVYNQIIEDGYVRNTRLFRRFVTAQMFRNLNYKSYDGREAGYHAALKRYGYHYTFEMMLDEVKVLSKLEVRDVDSFNERKHFFTRDVVVKVCEDYINNLKAYVDGLKTKNCKGVPYKKIKGENIFVEDLNKKVYQPLQYKINTMRSSVSYTDIYKALQSFTRDMIRLPWETPKSKVWIDAYKGAGAYYTCKNLIMFHDCRVKLSALCDAGFYDIDKSIAILNSKLDEYKGEGWRMFAFMKKLIGDNHFDFKARMREIYNK